jgi:prepilin-type N-terminal cleavage/methylation domain-containing protein
MNQFKHTTQAAALRGFTLIEVLIASFVIALGTLGLIALFAGAASQQRVASQTTASVIVSKNAEAIIAPRFGRIEGTLFDGIDEPGNSELERGVWHPVPADSRGNLSISPRGSDNPSDFDARQEAYFVLERNETSVLYSLPNVSNWVNIAIGKSRYPEDPPLNNSPYEIRSFPVDRLDAQLTGVIDVNIGERFGPNPQDIGTFRVSFIYVPVDYADGRPLDWPTGVQFSPNGEVALFSRNGELPGDDQDYIVVRRNEDPVGNGSLSFIDRIRLAELVPPTSAGGNPRFIEQISVPRIVYRSANVISASDRVIEVRDNDFEAGVRPDIGYSLLFRKRESGDSQIALFTYFINGSDLDGRFRLAEREVDRPSPFGSDSGSDEWALRMIPSVQLAFDDDRGQHYFLAESDEQIAALAPGAILLVSGEDSGGANRVLGADLPVRVVRQIRAPNGNGFRSYIDRVPRFAGKSMLPFRNQTRNLDLWTIRETVEAIDGSRWNLQPRELRIFNTN